MTAIKNFIVAPFFFAGLCLLVLALAALDDGEEFNPDFDMDTAA